MIIPALSIRLSRPQLSPLCFLTLGFLPVSSIVLHCLGILSLPLCLSLLIFPLLGLSLCSGFFNRETVRIAWKGWLAGIIAVTFYDLSRLPFILAGWGDFIPKIGAWLTETENPNVLIGYAWRYIGNGGGLGIAFFMLMHIFGGKEHLLRYGITFGIFVFASLIVILSVFREAQEMMFRITPLTFAGSLTGHIIYGLTLGLMAKKSLPQSREGFC